MTLKHWTDQMLPKLFLNNYYQLRYLTLITTLILPVLSFAQQKLNTDSIYFYRQSEKENQYLYGSATHLSASKLENSGLASLSYQNSTGHFRKAQEAENNTITSIYTEGLNTLGRFKASGYFSFSRIYQDSLAWTTKGTELDAQTYYFVAAKAGKFERSDYQLGGVLSYAMVPGKLYPGLGVNYNYRESTRSIDPRPKVNNYSLILKPELVYQFKDQYAGIQATWGYDKESFNSVYKNDTYKTSTAYPERVTYLVYGYGNMRNYQNDQKMRRNGAHLGLAFNYSGDFSKLKILTRIAYKQLKEESRMIVANSINDSLLGTFYLNDLTARILIKNKNKTTAQQLSVDFLSTTGYDKSSLYEATNYHYSRQIIDAEYLIRLKSQSPISTEFGPSLSFERLEKIDVVTTINTEVAGIESGLSGSLYVKSQKNNLLSFGAGISYRKPINHTLNVPELQTVNTFVKGVVYGNYQYDTSDFIKLKAGVNYISNNLFKEFKTGFAVQGTYLSQINSKFTFPDATFSPNHQRVHLNISLNLYF